MADAEGKKLTELRVIDLKMELERRGLDKTGNKAALLERLSKVFTFSHFLLYYLELFLVLLFRLLYNVNRFTENLKRRVVTRRHFNPIDQLNAFDTTYWISH